LTDYPSLLCTNDIKLQKGSQTTEPNLGKKSPIVSSFQDSPTLLIN